ncbi:hypothetical protein ACJIZ3_010351 [Penstemon smallii]|uniref:Uncharacterized protein n=1 Tax=Penstemon smallii TaxID=265156 RepID=A0ABD3TGQ1_9LAMI
MEPQSSSLSPTTTKSFLSLGQNIKYTIT